VRAARGAIVGMTRKTCRQFSTAPRNSHVQTAPLPFFSCAMIIIRAKQLCETHRGGRRSRNNSLPSACDDCLWNRSNRERCSRLRRSTGSPRSRCCMRRPAKAVRPRACRRRKSPKPTDSIRFSFPAWRATAAAKPSPSSTPTTIRTSPANTAGALSVSPTDGGSTTGNVAADAYFSDFA
jgi:hypothetical protein